jgi:hypothetical protein
VANLIGDSAAPGTPGVFGENTAGGDGVSGKGRRGVVGESDTFQGVFGISRDNAGVVGESTSLHGVFGVCHNPHGAGVFGTNDQAGGFGVQGINESGDGVIGRGRRGVVGESDTFQGVFGISRDNAGVVGESTSLHGVFGICHNPNGGGVFGTNDAGGFAAVFDGKVSVTGNLEVTGDIFLTNADCAENFDVAAPDTAEPGTLMVLGDEGTLQQCQQPYDKRVVGVVSGAAGYKPGIVLDKQELQVHRKPIALLGKVFCKVDADHGAIEVGDLLTTSPTPGHAMKAIDPQRAFGAVIGKALRCFSNGRGLIPVLIALQ